MNHFCLVFELLGPSVFDELKSKMYSGFPLSYIQNVLKCILPALSSLAKHGLMHCDIKPENILCSENRDINDNQNSAIKSCDYSCNLYDKYSSKSKSADCIKNVGIYDNNYDPDFKLIDFGSCMFYGYNNCFYLQSRYYRAPEVILQIPFDSKIDIWSLGCVAAELFLGLPLFPALNDIHLASLIEKTIGKFPESMQKISPRQFMLFDPDGNLKSPSELCYVNNCEDFTNWKPYFMKEKLEGILNSFESGRDEDNGENRNHFIDLLIKMLVINPSERITANEALNHPFFKIDFK